MRRAIVHIGLPRTGTTTLQRVLSRLRPGLAGASILYPELTPASAPGQHLSHQYLGEALDGRRPAGDRVELLDRLSEQLATTGADTVLLSYEGLCLLPPRLGVPEMLSRLLARHGFAMEALLSVKPQAELVNSAYTWRTQFLREGRPFPRFFHTQVSSPRFAFGAVLSQWHAPCEGRLRAVPVRDARSARPLVERTLEEVGLLDRVGPMLEPDDLSLVDNRSPGPVAVEAARRLHRGGAQLRPGLPARDVARFAEEDARARGFDAAPYRGLEPAQRDACEARWADANARFARLVWGTEWAARVAPEPAVPVNDVLRAPDRDGDAAHAVEQVVAATCARFGLRLRTGPGTALRSAAASAADGIGRALRLRRVPARS